MTFYLFIERLMISLIIKHSIFLQINLSGFTFPRNGDIFEDHCGNVCLSLIVHWIFQFLLTAKHKGAVGSDTILQVTCTGPTSTYGALILTAAKYRIKSIHCITCQNKYNFTTRSWLFLCFQVFRFIFKNSNFF